MNHLTPSVLIQVFCACLVLLSNQCVQGRNDNGPRSILFKFEDSTKLPEHVFPKALGGTEDQAEMVRVGDGKDQDKLGIPSGIIERWDVFASQPFQQDSLVSLRFVGGRGNTSDLSEHLMFVPNLLNQYQLDEEALLYSEYVDGFTAFVKTRVVGLDLSSAVIPEWYYSRIQEFSKLRILRLSAQSVYLASEELKLPKSLRSLHLEGFEFSPVLLSFIQRAEELETLSMNNCWSSQVTAIPHHDAANSFEDWISHEIRTIDGGTYHSTISSINLSNCDEQVFFGFIRLELPSLEYVFLGLREVYPGSNLEFQLELLIKSLIRDKCWPGISCVTFLLDGVDRSRTARDLLTKGLTVDEAGFKELISHRIRDLLRREKMEKRPQFEYLVSVDSQIE